MTGEVSSSSISSEDGLTEHQRRQQEAFESEDPIAGNSAVAAIEKSTSKVVEKTERSGKQKMNIREEYIGTDMVHLNYGESVI